MFGITFNGYHSYNDKRLTMAPGKKIGRPSKEKIKVKVPFSNHEYDFSELYGSQVYTNRSLEYKFNLIGQTKEQMSIEVTDIINWFMNSHGKQKLYDDAYPGYFFMAEVESEANFEENYTDGILGVKFTAYPFMISELEEGHDTWDNFNFVLDYDQITDFTINGSQDVMLYNGGSNVVKPTIIASTSMEILMKNKTYLIPSGTSESYDFMLEMGENNLTITGDGTISFVFYKELI